MVGCACSAWCAAMLVGCGGGEADVEEADIGTVVTAAQEPAVQDAEVEEEDGEIAWVTAESGLMYRDLVVGEGAVLGPRDSARVELTVRVSGEDRAFVDREVVVRLNDRNLAAGIREGIIGTKEGTTRELRIPAELAYADVGRMPDVPPDSMLEATVVVIEKVFEDS